MGIKIQFAASRLALNEWVISRIEKKNFFLQNPMRRDQQGDEGLGTRAILITEEQNVNLGAEFVWREASKTEYFADSNTHTDYIKHTTSSSSIRHLQPFTSLSRLSLEVPRSHTHGRTTVGRTPLDE